jgi:signal peptidase I
MIESQRPKPALFVRRIEEGTISGRALAEILQAVLDRGAPFRFRATGFSMTPFVRDGDIVTLAPLSGAPVRRGEVVAFMRPETNKLVIHRVVGQQGDALLIQGDNVHKADGPIPSDHILGRVTRVERGGRPVYLGLGPERQLIALLSRWGLFHRLLRWVWPVLRPIARLVRRVR